MNRNRKIFIASFCFIWIAVFCCIVYRDSLSHEHDESGSTYTSIEEFEKKTGLNFYPYYDFYEYLQNKNTYLKDIMADVEIFVTYDNMLYFIRSKDSYVENTISYDTKSYFDAPIYDKYEMETGILYIYPPKNDNTTFESNYISDKMQYSIYYMKEKMIDYANYFDKNS